MANYSVSLVLDAKAELGEGVCWDWRSQVLYWVDINRYELHVFDPETNSDRSINVGEYIGTVAPRAGGGLVLGLQHRIVSCDLDTGEMVTLCSLEADRENNRINDGKCGPDGRFWVGTMDLDCQEGAGGFYCVDTDYTMRTILRSVGISNGLCWRSDHSILYYIDLLTRKIDAFDFDAGAGTCANRRPVVDFGDNPGSPDGMNIDAEDKLWVASFGGGCVMRWDPDTGELMQTIELPVTNVTNCAFGGRELDRLYISTARVLRTEEDLAKEPLAGGLFVAEPGVRGVRAFEYGG
ncbi:MAG: SMP-30/gluconolactonase/LRE family protein [Chitinivibrionales bacterium]|nr:SMP-30/gluconolactonase/LRE family protein [Chitinivibrionales bacterium]MBD3394733.1 SMP-30/gluconolactonase/LRE family protein [Chitinivibrionales bacterium]